MDPLNLSYFVTCYIQLKRSRSHRTAIRVEGPGNETRPQSALTSVYGIAYLKIPVLRLADLPDPQPFSFSPSNFSKWARASWIIYILTLVCIIHGVHGESGNETSVQP